MMVRLDCRNQAAEVRLGLVRGWHGEQFLDVRRHALGRVALGVALHGDTVAIAQELKYDISSRWGSGNA